MNKRSRKYKRTMRLFNCLKDAAKLSTNPGRMIREKYKRPTGKARRHSGRKTVYYDLFGGYAFMETFWDNWTDYRDGMRDRDRCFYWNFLEDNVWVSWLKYGKARIKKQYQIRKARREKYKRILYNKA